jgi:hypothetical protein
MEKQPTPKSAVVTLHAGGSTLTFLATLKNDGRAVTTVTTRDAEKKSTRGDDRGAPQHGGCQSALVHTGGESVKARVATSKGGGRGGQAGRVL